MRTIPLSRGKVATVDDQDFSRLSKFKWYVLKTRSGFYAVRMVLMHNQIKRASKNKRLDHADGDGLNNTRKNLRPATISQNGGNRRKSPGMSSKYKGVCWDVRAQGWVSNIQFRRTRYFLGTFKTERAAAKAYDKAAIEHFGEFACLNFR